MSQRLQNVREPSNPSGLCQCGCGERTRLARITSREKGWIKGEPIRFVWGHHLRGVTNPNYKWGLSYNGRRALIVCRDLSTVLYARAVMEAHLKRKLRTEEEVHHINEDPSDDRIENLELLSHREHIERHSKLTPDAVRAIYASDGVQRVVGLRFGISQTTVSNIKRGKRRVNITRELV